MDTDSIRSMSKEKASLMQIALQRFFYKARINIPLTSAIKQEEYLSFRVEVEKALSQQILFYAKFEKVNMIVGLEKIDRILTDEELYKNLSENWEPLFNFLSDERLLLFLLWAANQGGISALRSLSRTESFDLTNKSVIAKIKRYKNSLETQLDETTKSWISRAIQTGLQDEYSIIEIAKLLRDNARSISRMRSYMIAEYELLHMMNQIVEEVYKRSGVESHKWVTSHDERVCDICSGNEASGIITIGKSFSSGHTSPPAHVNCRCFLVPTETNIDEIWIGI